MNNVCDSCEAEFYIEMHEEVKFCPACGEELDNVIAWKEDLDLDFMPED